MKQLTFILSMLVCGAAAGAESNVFRAGAATSNITPSLGSDLIGGFNPRGSTHIHDDLHVRCLALDDGETKLAIALVDNVQFPREIHDAAKALINEATGLPKENILIAATHTHSAPSLRGPSYTVLGEPLDDYQKFVIQRIADGVRRALNNLEPARIGWGVGEVPKHVFNRRWLLKDGQTVTSPFGDEELAVMNPGRYRDHLLEPAGPVNPKLYFISVEATDGRPIALLANYWLHYVGGVEQGHVSADYFGVFANRVQQLLSDPDQDPPFVGMLSNGASADINNNDYANYGKQPRYAKYEKMRLIADDLAKEIVRVREAIEHCDWVKLGAAQSEMTLNHRRPSPEQATRAKALLENAQPDDPEYGRRAIFARRALDAVEWPETVDVVVQTFRIGDLGIAALPFEVFAEIGFELEDRSPFETTLTFELANGGLGYLPTPKQHELGGYETWLTVSRVEKAASPKLVNRLVAQFQQLQEPKGEPAQSAEFKHAGVLEVWNDFAAQLSFGRGQTLALVDDGCKMSMPEWTAVMPDGRPKVLVTHDAVDGDDNPQHEGRGYHGSTIGIPSSVNHGGKLGVAYNNQLAVIRGNECCHCSIEDSRESLAAALQWVLDHHEEFHITTVNLAPVDDQEHAEPVATEIDAKLAALRKANIWVSAPAGNHNFTGGISWPASQPNCFAIGAVKPGSDDVIFLDRHEKVALLVPARATSSSNAIVCGAVMILREAIEKSGYDWSGDGATLPDAMMTILQRTGAEVEDPAAAGRMFRRLDLGAAVRSVLDPHNSRSQTR